MSGRSLVHIPGTSRTVGNAVPLDVAIVDGSGNQITTFGGSGGTSNTDESAFTAGSGLGTPAMGLYELSPTTLSAGQVGVVGMTTDRKLKVSGSFSATPPSSSTATTSTVAASVTSVQLLASNASRQAFTLYNDSSANCYVKLGLTASTSSFWKKLLPGDMVSTQDLGINYTGEIDGIWDSATGNMRVVELT